MTDQQIEQMAKVLQAILEIPVAARLDLVGAALRVAIEQQMLTREVDLKLILRHRFPTPIPTPMPPLPVPGSGR